MSKSSLNPIAVCTGDVHFTFKNLELASHSIRLGLSLAEDLQIPFIINGDLLDAKATIRAECANAIIDIIKFAKVQIIISPGNHDSINTKGSDHALKFLKPYALVIDYPQYVQELKSYVIPYQDNLQYLRNVLSTIPKGSTIFMHQGLLSAEMGAYAVDKTSISHEELKDFRVILSHYHKAQTIGTCSYLGSPYSTSFSEALDGPKGIQILYSDGSLDLIHTNLRKHVVVERTIETLKEPIRDLNKDDLLWIKVSGPSIELDKLKKKDIGIHHLGHQSFKLDLISTDVKPTKLDTHNLSKEEIIDTVIDKENIDLSQKIYLKDLWRALIK